MKAVFNGTVIAESDQTVVVEGNHYFPRASVIPTVLTATSHTSACPWKGTAAYYDIAVGDELASNAAWYYPEPKDAAIEITDHIAFYPVVTISE